jgi:hypothetical protein
VTDPILALEAMEPESPPREVVLGALRLFRYRVIATVAVAALLIGALFWFASGGRGSALPADVAIVIDHPQATFEPADGTTMIGAVRVSVTEVATSPEGRVARLVFEAIGERERSIELGVLRVAQGTTESSPGNVSIQDLGRDGGRRSTAVWVPLDPRADPFTAQIEVFVLPVPDSILDEGGELSSDDGITGIVTIERTSNP